VLGLYSQIFPNKNDRIWRNFECAIQTEVLWNWKSKILVYDNSDRWLLDFKPSEILIMLIIIKLFLRFFDSRFQQKDLKFSLIIAYRDRWGLGEEGRRIKDEGADYLSEIFSKICSLESVEVSAYSASVFGKDLGIQSEHEVTSVMLPPHSAKYDADTSMK
jgi:hypothetical protein